MTEWYYLPPYSQERELAGSLDDLVQFLIEQIEKQAKADPRFRFALGGVWQNSIPDPIWQRVTRITGGPGRR